MNMPEQKIPRKKIDWTEENCDLLKSLYRQGKTITECAEILHITYKSAACQLCRLRLVNKHRRYKWTDERLNYVRRHFPVIPTDTIALIMGVSESRIRSVAKELGVKKDPQHLWEMHSYVGKCQGKNKRKPVT